MVVSCTLKVEASGFEDILNVRCERTILNSSLRIFVLSDLNNNIQVLNIHLLNIHLLK